MKLYALIQNGVVDNIIETDDSGWPEGVEITALENRPGIGWIYSEDTGFAPPQPDNESVPPDSEPVPERRIITNLAFDLRFTMQEQVAIDLASIDHPSAPLEQREQSAALRVSKARAKKALFIDLDDPVTRSGVTVMEQAGLLAEGRALDILDAAIQEGERPWNV